jgi:PAS domain S-box-containing protein
MGEEPDIIKQLRNEEAIGKLWGNLQLSSEEFERLNELTDETAQDNQRYDENHMNLESEDQKKSRSIHESDPNEKKLEEIEERYKALFNSPFELIYLHDFKGKFIDANTAALKLLGYSRDEIKNLNFSELLDRGQLWKAFQTLREIKKYGHQKKPIIYTIKSKNGEFIYVETTAEIVYQNGQQYAIQGIARNITEQQKADEIKKLYEQEMQITLEATTDGIWKWNFITNNLEFSPRYYMMLGYEPGEFPANFESWMNLLHPDDKEKAIKVAEQYLKNKSDTYENEFRLRMKNGEYRWIHALARVVERDTNGHAIRIVGHHKDITDKKIAEQEIQSLAKFTLNDPFPVLRISQDGTLIFANSASAIILKLWNTKVGAKVPERWSGLVDTALKTNKIIKNEKEETENGRIFSFTILPMPNDGYTNIYTHDITEEFIAKQQIEKSEENYKRLFNSIPLAIVETDEEGNFLAVNQRMAQSIGLPVGTLIGKNVFDIFPKDIAEYRAKIARTALMENKIIEIEDKRGERYFYNTYVPIIHSNGKKTIQSIVRETTYLKKIEIANKENERRYRTLVENASDQIFMIDSKLKMISLNKTGLTLLKKNENEVVGKHISEIFPKQFSLKNIIKVFETGCNALIEEQLAFGNQLMWVQSSLNPVKNEQGEIVAVQGVVRDISSLKKTEENLKRRNKDLKCLYNISKIVEKDENLENLLHKIVQTIKNTWDNPELTEARIIWNKKELKTQGFQETTRKLSATIFSYKKPVGELEICYPENFAVLDDDQFLNEKKELITLITERIGRIIERKTTEKTLIQSEEKYRLIADFPYDWEDWYDENRTLQYISPSCERITGYSKEMFLKDPEFLFSIIHPDDKQKILNDFNNLFFSNNLHYVYFRIFTKNGDERWMSRHCQPVYDPSGTFRGRRGSNRDITEQKKDNESLRISEEKLSTITSSAQDAIIMMDFEGNVSFWNNSAEKIFGYTSQEVLGKNLHQTLTPAGVHAAHQKGFDIFKKTGTGAAVGKTLELTGKRKDGTDFPLELSLSSVEINDKWHAIGILRDITQRKKTEIVLKEKIDELERFKKLTVDRELKMVELKKKIDELQKADRKYQRDEKILG